MPLYHFFRIEINLFFFDKVKAVASINGAPFMTNMPMLYKGSFIGESLYVC